MSESKLILFIELEILITVLCKNLILFKDVNAIIVTSILLKWFQSGNKTHKQLNTAKHFILGIILIMSLNNYYECKRNSTVLCS